VPGVKLGLANAVTLFALFYGKKKPHPVENTTNETKDPTGKAGNLTIANAFTILLCRITLGAVFTGRVFAFIYSLTGGLLGFAAQVAVKRFVTDKQIWVCGAIGAIFHNIGQILAAMLITGTPEIAAYLPVLVIAGIITGAITGLIAQLTLERIR
jgi:heptaprenyl diphosphate synthase